MCQRLRRVAGLGVLCVAATFSGVQVSASEGQAFLTSVTATPPPSGAQHLCRQYDWACSSRKTARLSVQQELQIVERVNRQVNASTRKITDQSQYNTQERWALPTSLGGDCEDFALLKKMELVRAGVDPNKLLIATVLDSRRNGHAVLIYRSAKGDVVLDNQTNRIKLWSKTRYLFLRMQDPAYPKRWVGVFVSS